MFSTEDHKRGNITFFSTYRPPVQLEIYSSPVPPASNVDELQMLDGVSYNYNGQVIPPAALHTILKHTNLDRHAKPADADSGKVTGMVFVSERTDGLETLHIGLRHEDEQEPKVEVFNLAELYGMFSGMRMEDSGRVAGDNDQLVYVTTKEPADRRRQPWTAVCKTSLKNGRTHRITPSGVADLSPAVSPSGKKIAVASFEKKEGGWAGEIEDLKTDIFVMNIDEPNHRTLVIENGGWPSWGGEDILFFHRKVGDNWAVFRADLSQGTPISDAYRVSPDGIDAMTPAAIDANRVAVATIRQKSNFGDVRVEVQYRHVEIFDSSLGPDQVPIQITQVTKPLADHFNPFVMVDRNGVLRIGYHRCQYEGGNDFPSQISQLKSPEKNVGVCRVAGAFPSFSKDGTKMAFVDNEFKAVYLADYEKGIRPIYKGDAPDSVFSPVWSQNPEKDTLYVCMGKSFKANEPVQICAIPNISSIDPHGPLPSPQPLTDGDFNNAFPSTNAEGTRLVFRSTRDGGEKKHKNLYIMEDAQVGEYGGRITRLTNGPWTDTHCEWSPNQDWIVFSSTRDKPQDAPETDNGLDPGYFAVFLVKANDPDTVIRVIGSGYDLAGHVNHPFFSPDGKSIVVVSDLAAVSCDPISLPLFLHSVRPYGDIFTVDIDSKDIKKNKDVEKFNRVTHSRFENSTASWAMVTLVDLNKAWELISKRYKGEGPFCPYLHQNGGHTFHLTGHIQVPLRLC